MTEHIELSGKKLPIRRTLGAMKKFDNEFDDMSVLEFGSKPMRVEHIIALMWCFIEAGYKAEGKAPEVDREWIEDNVSLDDFAKLSQKLMPSDGKEGEKKT